MVAAPPRCDSDIRPQTSDIRLRGVNGQRSFKDQGFDVSPRLELGPKAQPNGMAGLQRNWITEAPADFNNGGLKPKKR